MGSTTFGNLKPAMTELAAPTTFSIDRAGFRRVRIDGRA
jgi:hypothetical protein